MKDNKKVAVITGGASGIGLALAKACLLKDMHVVIADNATQPLQTTLRSLSTLSGNKVLGILCDVSKITEVQQLAQQVFTELGRVDLLVNNAGISGRLAPLWELAPEEIGKVFEVNLYGVINGIHAFLPKMLPQSHPSHIVNMASVYALCSGSYMGAYAASKHAILALSESLYFELRQQNKELSISVVCPSFANTNLITHSLKGEASQLDHLVNSLMERSRPVEEVADLIMREIEKRKFYILPDKEVKNYAEERVQAISSEEEPSEHSLERLITGLSKRAQRK